MIHRTQQSTVQLTLEQHGLELLRSTYVDFFSSKFVLHSPWLLKPADYRTVVQRAECNVIHGFLTVQGLTPLTPMLFKSQLYLRYSFIITVEI